MRKKCKLGHTFLRFKDSISMKMWLHKRALIDFGYLFLIFFMVEIAFSRLTFKNF